MTKKHIDIDYAEFTSLDELSGPDRELAMQAIHASSRAYSPYSKFNVGAAVRLADGTVVTGSNQENIAFPSGICAERTAMFYASSKHPDSPMAAIAVAGQKGGILCEDPATPCGACRQVMAEYQTKSGQPMEVILIGGKKIWKFSKVDDLLPLLFDSL